MVRGGDWRWWQLPREHLELARRVGIARNDQAYGRDIEGANNLRLDRTDAAYINVIGALGEAAVHGYFGGDAAGLTWNALLDGRAVKLGLVPELLLELAGSDVKIDAKGIDDQRKGLLVKQGGVHRDWIYLLVSTQHCPRMALIGWATGADILKVPLTEPRPNRPGHLLPQTHPLLRPIDRLEDYGLSAAN